MTLLIVLIVTVSIGFFIAIKSVDKSYRNTPYDYGKRTYSSHDDDGYDDDDWHSSGGYHKPKISAEVSDVFRSQVQSYCNNHSLTVSEFVRRSAKDYMSNNP